MLPCGVKRCNVSYVCVLLKVSDPVVFLRKEVPDEDRLDVFIFSRCMSIIRDICDLLFNTDIDRIIYFSEWSPMKMFTV